MTRRIAIVAAAGIVVIVVAVLAALEFDWFGPADPADAQCTDPSPAFGESREASDHLEVDVTYTCMDAVQAATIYLPPTDGQHPAVVWVHGAGEAARIPYQFPVFRDLVAAGVAVMTYDKRGVGESEGECCPGDSGKFNLLTADVDGAIEVLRSRPEIDPEQIGLIGASQAGWIAPGAAVDENAAFMALAAAPTVGHDIANRYERLAAGEEGDLTLEEIAEKLRSTSPGFDPLPDLERLDIPELWLFGDADENTPTPESMAILDQLQTEGHDITVIVYPDAGHGLLDTPPTTPDAGANLVAWVKEHVGLLTGE